MLRLKSEISKQLRLKVERSLTDTLHGLIGSALVWRAADITSPTVWIQALLTFCAKIAIETRFTIVYFTFWKTQERQKESIKWKDQTSWSHIESGDDDESSFYWHQGFVSSGNTKISILLMEYSSHFLAAKS